ncbi:chaperone SurA precursor [bacterium BMS3Abin03]|nr:chaperone SurA precursor [bacterium BMS3Abin03]HDZ58640.1 parvulin peptidyl-prolyl isomerase [Ignavibacteriales bacterium]
MKLKLIPVLLLFISTVFAQEVLDRIVAVVDNEIILQSELDFQVNIFAAQRKIDPKTPGLKNQILQNMIDEKLIYAQAQVDSITVTDEEIGQRIDYQIQVFKQQYGSIKRIEELYGMSIERIKRELKDDVEKNLMVQKLQQKMFGTVEASRREVEEFFETYKDSIGMIPEKLKIYHIFRNPKASSLAKKKARELAEALLDSIKAGADFSELAKKYSKDPGSAAQGGDLGFVKRGVFYPEFEAVAFSLAKGQISDVVESPVGFHIIQLLERRGESIHTRHILIKIEPDDQADLRTIEFLSAIRDSIINGDGTFQEYAKKYSEDKETAAFGGELGTYYINQLDKNLLDIVSKLKPGEISFPRRIDYGPGNYGYQIVYLESRIPQHPADINEDYKEIKKLANELKKQKEYDKWIKELKKKIYWEIRI